MKSNKTEFKLNEMQKYIKVDYSKEKPTKTGRYFTWNEYTTTENTKRLEMEVTLFDLEKNIIWSPNKVKFWLKPIDRYHGLFKF